MTDHDPMCPVGAVTPVDLAMSAIGDPVVYTPQRGVVVATCLCNQIARVRVDERERLRAQVAQVPQLPLWGTGLVRVSDVLALLGGDS